MKYKVLKTLKSNELKPSLWVTPVLEQVADGYKPHHVEVSVGFNTKKFVPIEHVSNHRRRILDLEDENAKLEDENEKLRKSVRNLLTCIKHEECEESCPHYSPAYDTYGYNSHGSIVVGEEYLGCCLVGLENCKSAFFDTDEYLRELGIEVEQ